MARIFADLIKADRIVDTGEMSCWRQLCEKYVLDRDVRVEARSISFADALTIVCNCRMPGLPSDLLGDCRIMTVSDGFCTHSEALLMIALIATLSHEASFTGEVISIPRASFNIDIGTVLYVESERDEEVNEAIECRYRSIFKELQLVGLHFVYIPRIIDHYRDTDPELFKDILSFLAPSINESGLDSIYESLTEMTTDRFCKDLLCNKCGITELRNTQPALLLKIGNSFVDETPYANYLKIGVGGNIMEIVEEFVDRFTEMLRSDMFVVSTSEERDRQFHFHGFYKQLLDIFLVRRDKRSTVHIDPYKEDIIFPDIDTKASGLNRRERALYALLLCQGTEGLNFKQPKSVREMEDYSRRMEKIQRRYELIYETFGGDREMTPDLSVDGIRRPIVSRLKSSLSKLKGLYNPQDYNITKNSDGSVAVHIEPELVYVRSLKSGEFIKLHESQLYERVMAL
ncbi:MAG: hypothetical protein K2N88_05375 [Muribaculaceae bacterium]|nr:hypothetical protein [Muribaculaceae bacterium]